MNFIGWIQVGLGVVQIFSTVTIFLVALWLRGQTRRDSDQDKKIQRFAEQNDQRISKLGDQLVAIKDDVNNGFRKLEREHLEFRAHAVTDEKLNRVATDLRVQNAKQIEKLSEKIEQLRRGSL